MYAQITATLKVEDETVLEDALGLFKTTLPYMGDNVTVTYESDEVEASDRLGSKSNWLVLLVNVGGVGQATIVPPFGVQETEGATVLIKGSDRMSFLEDLQTTQGVRDRAESLLLDNYPDLIGLAKSSFVSVADVRGVYHIEIEVEDGSDTDTADSDTDEMVGAVRKSAGWGPWGPEGRQGN